MKESKFELNLNQCEKIDTKHVQGKENRSKTLNMPDELPGCSKDAIINLDYSTTDVESNAECNKISIVRRKNALNVEKEKEVNNIPKTNNFQELVDDSSDSNEENEFQSSNLKKLQKKPKTVRKFSQTMIESDTSSCSSPTKRLIEPRFRRIHTAKNALLSEKKKLMHPPNSSLSTNSIDSTFKPLGFDNDLERWMENTKNNPLISSSTLPVSFNKNFFQ